MKQNRQFKLNALWKHPYWILSSLVLVFAFVLNACSGYTGIGQASGAGIPNTGVQPTPAATADDMMHMQGQATGAPAAQPNQGVSTATATKAYIGLFKDNAVAVLDTATNQVLKTIPVPTGPHGIVVSPDGRRVYVSSDGDSKVSVIDTNTDSIVDTIEVGKAPHGLAITPDGQLVLAAVFGTDQVAFIYTPADAVIGYASVASPHNIAISPDGRTAYVAAQKQGAAGLAVLDIIQETQTAFIPLDQAPRALNFSPDGKWLFFTQAGVDAVEVLDPATNLLSDHIPVGASPHHPLFTQDGKEALVVSQGPGQLSIIDAQTRQVNQVVKVGKMPHWIAVNAQGTTAWVTNEASNDVSVVDLASGQVTATIPVGNAPRKIAILPQAAATAQQPAAGQAGVKTSIQNLAFVDQTIQVKVGQQITWVNNDSIVHTVTSDNGQFDSGNLNPAQSFTLTLDQPGRYTYHCSLHPFMTGTIVVTQ